MESHKRSSIDGVIGGNRCHGDFCGCAERGLARTSPNHRLGRNPRPNRSLEVVSGGLVVFGNGQTVPRCGRWGSFLWTAFDGFLFEKFVTRGKVHDISFFVKRLQVVSSEVNFHAMPVLELN